MDDAQLRTVWQQRRFSDRAVHLSQPLALLMKQTLSKRVSQLCKLSQIWDEVIPQSISSRTALEGFSRGVLTVIVNSATHRFQLRTLLDGGLSEQIQGRFSGAINKIRLIPGQFSTTDPTGAQRYEF